MKNYEDLENAEMELDSIIESIGEQIIQGESTPGILHLPRVQKMQFSYAVLQKLCKDEDMTVRYIQNEPFKSMGSIYVEGDSLSFLNCKWLSRAVEFADNVEIYGYFTLDCTLTDTALPEMLLIRLLLGRQ